MANRNSLDPGRVHKVELSFRVPEIVSRGEVAAFIKDALEAWGGSRHPEDALFHSLGKVVTKFHPDPSGVLSDVQAKQRNKR